MITAEEARNKVWDTSRHIGYLEWLINIKATIGETQATTFLRKHTNYNKIHKHFTDLGYSVRKRWTLYGDQVIISWKL